MPMGEATPKQLAVRGCILALALFAICTVPAAAQDAKPNAIAAAGENEAPPPAPLPLARSDINPADAHQRAQDIAERHDVQTEIPDFERPRERSGMPTWLVELLAGLLRIIGWILLGLLLLGLGILLFLMFTDLEIKNFRLGRRKTVGEGDVTHEPEDEPLWSRDALARADELARQGEYDEAIHVLLLGSFGELKHRRAASLPPSLTSREIIDRIRVSNRARDALWLMIGSVEVSHFGGQSVGKPVFDSCRDAFLAFAEPEGAA